MGNWLFAQSTEPSGVGTFLEMVGTNGLATVVACYAIYYMFKQMSKYQEKTDASEKELKERVSSLETFYRDELVSLVKSTGHSLDKNTRAIEDNSRVTEEMRQSVLRDQSAIINLVGKVIPDKPHLITSPGTEQK